MDFSQSPVTVSSFADRSITPAPPSPAASSLLSSPPFSSSALKHCRSSGELDFDPRDDRLGPVKLPRTDSFSRHPDLKMQISGNGILGSLVRNNSMIADGRLGCSPTNSSASDGVLLTNDSSLLSENRLMRNDSVISYPGSVARSLPYHHQSLPFRTAGLPLAMTREISNHFGMHDNERVAELPVFTASQVKELQHHALIFKYLMSGVSVPHELVLPIRNSVAALASLSVGSHPLATLGWGNYHLGYPNTTDPEPGRCRRTDGKKWRCARDVVPDQKYCERHMHRGRHRSRKPAENVSNASPPTGAGVAVSSTANSSSTSSVDLAASVPRASSAPSTGSRPACLNVSQQGPAAAPGLGVKPFSGSVSPNGLSIGSAIHGNQYQVPLQSSGGGTSGFSAKDIRYLNGDLGQEQGFLSETSGGMRGLGQESQAMSGLSVLSSVNNPWRSMQSKQQAQQQYSFLGGGGLGAVEAVNVVRESEGQPLRHFFDDWPRTRDPSALSWSDVDEDRSNRSSSTTQLSISIPVASSDFTAANAGSPRGKLTLSPLKLSTSRAGEDDPLGVDPTQMGLGVGMGLEMNDERHRQTNWIPITWEPSVGGPLAEVLQSSTPRECKNSALNLMTDGWDQNSPRDSPRISSPTGVLQSATFSAFSDTSTGSSPRAIKIEPNICDHLRSSEALVGSIEPSSC